MISSTSDLLHYLPVGPDFLKLYLTSKEVEGRFKQRHGDGGVGGTGRVMPHETFAMTPLTIPPSKPKNTLRGGAS